MREFKTEPFGDIVDLDDDATYDYLPKTASDLDDLMFKEIGQALVYIKHFHPDHSIYQCNRIHALVTKFANNRSDHYDDIKWLREQVFIFQDETENMC